ncbi:MAG: hypothetical protein ACK4ON_08370 [Bacteroidia bacterium]
MYAKKILIVILSLIAFNNINAQEKGSVLIGVTSPFNELISFDNIKTQIIQQYGVSIKKVEYCINHSLIHIVLNLQDLQAKSHPAEQDIVSFLSANFPNYVFHNKIIHESFETLNCKWK